MFESGDTMQVHPANRHRAGKRRGVSSVLAMMFLVIFSSLAAAMAVVAQGNLRTADSALKVSRAMSAAETGMAFATRQLSAAGRRFVVTQGVVDMSFANDLWDGTYNSADVVILPADGFSEDAPPTSLLEAIFNAHLDNDHYLGSSSESLTMDVDNGILFVPPVEVATTESSPPFFRLKYEILGTDPLIRVTSQGVDGDITRTLQMDYPITKKIEYAVLSMTRIMIGKNVRVEGPLGTLYGTEFGELGTDNGDPLVMRSDFYYLDAALDTKLDTFFAQVQAHDVDGDGRLRPDHPEESVGVDAAASVLVDHDQNEYVDDFDLFLFHYDANSNGVVIYDSALSGGGTVEFSGDSQLAGLIDEAVPDRNGDGVVDALDNALGYMDGAIDAMDIYGKVHGRLEFRIARATWDAANGATYQNVVEGPVITDVDEAPTAFEVPSEEMIAISTAMLDSSATWFYNEAQTGGTFGVYNEATSTWTGQVGSAIASGATYTHPNALTWESVPFGASGAYDYYQRPVFQDMTFTNVRIPKGTNGLFQNCTFIGVTFVETNVADCDDVNWNYAGSMQPDGSGGYEQRFPGLTADVGGFATPDTRSESNNIRFDSCTIIGSVSGDKPVEYTHWRNKIQMTGAMRFFIDLDDPDLADQPDEVQLTATINSFTANDITEMRKSSILLPGWSVDVGSFDNDTVSGSVNLKGVIVAGILDARGTVNIDGTLLMTFRPNADPDAGSLGPLHYGGQPDAFNTTIGYFGPADGDGEGMDPSDPGFAGFGQIFLRYDPDALLPDGIPWPLRVEPSAVTYVEGGAI